MDTGLGSKAYSIIEQGKIGLILSSKPADRRALIEEAAGHHEVQGPPPPDPAQARRRPAEPAARERHRPRGREAAREPEAPGEQGPPLPRGARGDAGGRARGLRAALPRPRGAARIPEGAPRPGGRAGAGRARGPGDGGGADRGAAHRPLRGRSAARGGPRPAGRADSGRGPAPEPGGLRQAAARGDGDARRRGAHGRRRSCRARVGPLHETLEARRSEESALHSELFAAEEEARAAELATGESTARQNEAETRQEQARDTQVGLLGRIAAFQNASTLGLGNGRTRRGRPPEARRGVGRAAARAGCVPRHPGSRRAPRPHGRGEPRRSACASERAPPTGPARRGERGEARAREAEALQAEASSLHGRIASLNEIIETHAAFDEGVRTLLSRPEGLEVAGVVADAVDTDKAYERALEAFVGDRLQAVLVPDAAQALRGIRYLQESNTGRGTFLPLASARTKADCGPLREVAAEEPKVKGLLSDFYRVSGPHADRIKASLPDALLLESLEDALDVICAAGSRALRDPRGRDRSRSDGRGRPRSEGPPRPPPRGARGGGTARGGGGAAPGGARAGRRGGLGRPGRRRRRRGRWRSASTASRRTWWRSSTTCRWPPRPTSAWTARRPCSSPSVARPSRRRALRPGSSPRSRRPSIRPRPSARAPTRRSSSWPPPSTRRAPPPRPRRSVRPRRRAGWPSCASAWPRPRPT